MLELRWEIEGEEQLARRLRGIETSCNDFKPEFQKSVDFLRDFFGGKVFDTRGAVIGEPWKPTGNPWPILEKTGKMRRSFRSKADKMSGAVWNAVDYFKYHQSNKPRRKLPRRVMMKLDNQRKNQIVKFFHEGLVKRVRKNV